MKTEKETKGLSCSILENKEIGNCSNGGISERVKEVVLVLDNVKVFEASESSPAVKIVKRIISGKPYYHAEPVKPVKRGNVGYMAGGSFIWTSDSRFPFEYPIALHDRQETPETYEALSK